MPRLRDCLAALVTGLSDNLVREAIVVDGTSTDKSAELAADMGCNVIVLGPEQRGRGRQLHAGAQAATGEWLLFLHGDSVLQVGWVTAVVAHLATKPEKAAYFRLGFNQSGSGPTRVAAWANWRARTLGLPYGDQGLLISRALYDRVGGYSDIPLMEDVNFVRRLGRDLLVPLDVSAVTSGAKFASGGWWAVPARNLFLVSAYHVGIKPDVLARFYK